MSFVNIYGGFERVVQTHGCALRKLYAWRGRTVQPLWRDLQNAVRKAAAAKAVEDAVVMKVAREVAALQAKKGEDAAAEDIKYIKPYVHYNVDMAMFKYVCKRYVFSPKKQSTLDGKEKA